MTEKFEYFDTGGNTAGNTYGVNWWAQTFTPQKNYSLEYVRLTLEKNAGGNPTTDFTVGIRATDGSSKPTGGDLVSKAVNAAGFPAWGARDWVTFTFASPLLLISGTKYSIVARLPGEAFADAVYWRANNAGGYARGEFWRSTNSGSSWDNSGGAVWDFYFEAYGTEVVFPPSGAPGLLIASGII